MARPKRVFPDKLHLFNLMHTQKVMMMSGVQLTALHLVKETPQYYISIDSWAFCCSQFKRKKKNGPLSVNIPTVTSKKAVELLERKASDHWVQKRLDAGCSEMKEAIAFLDGLFPDKRKVYLHEFKDLIASYCHGVFGRFDTETGEPVKEWDNALERRKDINRRYCVKGEMPKLIVELYEAYKNEKDEKKQEAALEKYLDAKTDYLYENDNVIPELMEITQNAVVCPYAFSSPTVEGSSYEHAGSFYFVVTENAVFFQVARSF